MSTSASDNGSVLDTKGLVGTDGMYVLNHAGIAALLRFVVSCAVNLHSHHNQGREYEILC